MSIGEIALSPLCCSLPLSLCIAFKAQTLLINNVPVDKNYLFFLFLFFAFTCSLLRSMEFNCRGEPSLSGAVTLPQSGQKHWTTVVFIWINDHEDDIQLHMYCTALGQSRIREWLIVLSRGLIYSPSTQNSPPSWSTFITAAVISV